MRPPLLVCACPKRDWKGTGDRLQGILSVLSVAVLSGRVFWSMYGSIAAIAFHVYFVQLVVVMMLMMMGQWYMARVSRNSDRDRSGTEQNAE